MIGLDESSGRVHFSYLTEILEHLGVPFGAFPGPGDAAAVILVDGTVAHPEPERLRAAAEAGATVVALGGVAGLPNLFGARALARQPEAWLDAGAADHPLLAGLPDLLHGFGVAPLAPQPGTLGLGRILDKAGALAAQAGISCPASLGAGLTLRRVGRGHAAALAADLPGTVVRIQQGWPVAADGAPAADGTVPLDDGILKADDGVALDYEVDRGPAPEGAPYFDRPVADQWREWLLRLVLWSHAEADQPVWQFWYWPSGVEAVAHISLDTDMCGEEPAYTTLAELERAGIKATFCVIYPEEWSRPVYDAIRAAGHEVGFHCNAMADTDQCLWGESYIRHQVAEMGRRAGQERFISSKQHVFRWQGEVEAFRLLERVGIRCDGSKGGSKIGNYGLPFGSCHPWFPLDPDAGRRIDVLEVPLLTMDMAYRTPLVTALHLLERVRRHHGVAHYGPHPIWIHTKPEVKAAVHALVAHARSLGMPFWTSAMIDAWERWRRRVTLQERNGGADVALPADPPPLDADPDGAATGPDAWIAIYPPPAGAGRPAARLYADGQPAEVQRATLHGHPALRARVPLHPGRRLMLRWQ